jgi:hypothetical protein
VRWLLGILTGTYLAVAPAVLIPLTLKFNLADWQAQGYSFYAALALLSMTPDVYGVPAAVAILPGRD